LADHFLTHSDYRVSINPIPESPGFSLDIGSDFFDPVNNEQMNRVDHFLPIQLDAVSASAAIRRIVKHLAFEQEH
jgi:hypothetical protein